MIYGYARVSTKGQERDGNSLEAQREALASAGAQKIYVDSFTGTKMDRPEFNALLSVLQSGDTFMVTKLDRFARSASEGSAMVESLLDKGIKVHVLNMGLMDCTPTGKLIRTVMLAFAEYERDMIVQRTQEGKAIAKATNPSFREGRPNKYTPCMRDHALKMLNEGYSYAKVSSMTGISKSTLQRIKRDAVAKDILNDD